MTATESIQQTIGQLVVENATLREQLELSQSKVVELQAKETEAK